MGNNYNFLLYSNGKAVDSKKKTTFNQETRINNRDGQTNTQKKHLRKTQNHTHGRQRKGGDIISTNKHFLTVKKGSAKKIQKLINDLNLYLENRHKLILFSTDGEAIPNNTSLMIKKGSDVNLTVPSTYKHLFTSCVEKNLYLFRGYAFYEKQQRTEDDSTEEKTCKPNCYVLIKKSTESKPYLFCIIPKEQVAVTEQSTITITSKQQLKYNIENPKVLDDVPIGTKIDFNNVEGTRPTIKDDDKFSYTESTHCFEAYTIPSILDKLHDKKIDLKTNYLNFHNEDEIQSGVRSAVGAVGNVAGNVVANAVSLPVEVVGTVAERAYQAANKAANAKKIYSPAKAVTVPLASAIGAAAGAVEGVVKGTKRLFDVQGQKRIDAPMNKIKSWINTPPPEASPTSNGEYGSKSLSSAKPTLAV